MSHLEHLLLDLDQINFLIHLEKFLNLIYPTSWAIKNWVIENPFVCHESLSIHQLFSQKNREKVDSWIMTMSRTLPEYLRCFWCFWQPFAYLWLRIHGIFSLPSRKCHHFSLASSFILPSSQSVNEILSLVLDSFIQCADSF